MEEATSSVLVAVRIRPLSPEENEVNSLNSITTVNGSNQIKAGRDYFTFDYTFPIDITQEQIYKTSTSDLVDSFFEGFNATILAYGQTGSGKTYTMGSAIEETIEEKNQGIIPRVIKKVFENISEKEKENPLCSYTVRVQFLELYGEDIRDLLDHTKTSKVTIRETPSGSVYVSGASELNITSFNQMMATLELGSRHRTTAATKMNQTSSRSHAIFTLFLERTIHPEPEPETGSSSDNDIASIVGLQSEVRKCKFHFVDLAGSERLKRTGAEGQQLKEGIDINKGLLALGNVISALGDELKRGRVHVPYRDSKLTRMLQDSLGGNSKTLMICCVSPAEVNFNESLNALRYANRARNIQNRPIVNRDPTSFLISELKKQLQLVSSELITSRVKLNALEPEYYKEPNTFIPIEILQSFVNAGPSQISFNNLLAKTNQNNNNSVNISTNVSNNSKLIEEVTSLKLQLSDSDAEIMRLNDTLKSSKSQTSDLNEKMTIILSELEFYKISSSISLEEKGVHSSEEDNSSSSPVDSEPSSSSSSASNNGNGGGYFSFLWPNKPNDANATTTTTSSSTSSTEKSQEHYKNAMKQEMILKISEYIKEIERLKLELKESKINKSVGYNWSEVSSLNEPTDNFDSVEFSSSIAKIISHAQEQLKREEEMLLGSTYSSTESLAEKAEEEYESRQKLLSTEVLNLTESIKMKEELVNQLQKSQEQYNSMRLFYQKRLNYLSKLMEAKQLERDSLADEIKKNLSTNSSIELKLQEELFLKDEELRKLKKKHQEVNRLTDIQSKYSDKLVNLDEEISSMKRQRVELTKLLQQEKRSHLIAINEKAREIEKLKKDLNKRSHEIKKLSEDKERAEYRFKDALREGAILRKKANLLQKLGPSENITAITKARKLALSRITNVNNKFFTPEQLKTKNWLDKRLSDITAKEKSLSILQQKYEQQLLLLEKKKNLELKRDSIENMNENNIDMESSKSKANYLEEINSLMEALDSQLSAKVEDIDNIQFNLMDSSGFKADICTLDQLLKNAKSLNEAIEIIKVLFDMLVKSRVTSSNQNDKIKHIEFNLKDKEAELQECKTELLFLNRNKEIELTKLTTSYEAKLFNLIESSSIDPEYNVNKNKNEANEMISMDHFNAYQKLTDERISFLKTENDRLNKFVADLKNSLFFKDSQYLQLSNSVSEKNDYIKFIEEECSVFKEIADELRSGMLAVTGTSSKSALKNLLSSQTRERLQFDDVNQDDDDEDGDNDDDDDDDDIYNNETMKIEFISLAEEIQKTGEVTIEKTTSRPVVFERLTNPSNFTGSQKNVFNNQQNIIKKKEKYTQNLINLSKVKRRESNSESNLLDRDNQLFVPNTTENLILNSYTTASPELPSISKDFENANLPDSPVLVNTFPPHLSSSRTKITLFNAPNENSSQTNNGTNVFSRLLNPSSYTGIHKYRGLQENSDEPHLLPANLKSVSMAQGSPLRARNSFNNNPNHNPN